MNQLACRILLCALVSLAIGACGGSGGDAAGAGGIGGNGGTSSNGGRGGDGAAGAGGGAGGNRAAVDASSDAQVACGNLDEARCGAQPACAGSHGRPKGATQVQFAGCRTNIGPGGPLLCNTAVTCAYPAGRPDQCWWFSSTCIPDGWVLESGCEAKNPACPPLSPR